MRSTLTTADPGDGSISAMRLSPAWRQALLAVDVVGAVGRLGVSAILSALGAAGLRGADPAVVRPTLGQISSTLLAPLAVMAWMIRELRCFLTMRKIISLKSMQAPRFQHVA